ncbi:MAG: hypothetical protein ACR2P5_04500 [Gammaproteobacteria bacterium]
MSATKQTPQAPVQASVWYRDRMWQWGVSKHGGDPDKGGFSLRGSSRRIETAMADSGKYALRFSNPLPAKKD